MKKVLILTVIALLALGLASFAANVTLTPNSGSITHVATSATGTTSVGVTSNFDVYQWYDYELWAPDTQNIKDYGEATLTIVNLWVSSNAALKISYWDTATNNATWINTFNNRGIFYWSDTNDAAHQLPGSATTFQVTPSSTTTNMTNVSLYWTGNIPYDLGAGTYWINMNVKIAPTIIF